MQRLMVGALFALAMGLAACGGAVERPDKLEKARVGDHELRSCYPAAGICGNCPPRTALDCQPVLPHPVYGDPASWDCYCCSGTSCQ